MLKGICVSLQGYSKDDIGGNVRVLDIIRGGNPRCGGRYPRGSKTYFHEYFPDILEKFMDACEAISFCTTAMKNMVISGVITCGLKVAPAHIGGSDFDYAFEL